MVLQRCFGGAIQIPDQCTAKSESLMLNCASKTNAMEVLLPSISSMNYRWVDIKIFDHDLCCAKNNITIKAEGNKINGSDEPIVLKNNGAGAIFTVFGANDWKCIQFE